MKRIIAIVSVCLGITACTDDVFIESDETETSEFSKSGRSAVSLTVMTRNMYVGANVDRVIEEQDPNQIPVRVAEEWARLESTNYPERARTLAKEIVANRPHLVGLQEVSLFRLQHPADFQLNATEIVLDFLTTLLSEIEAQGGRYRLVGIVEDTDVEIPRLNADFSLTDIRLTDYDAVLAREDVSVANVVAQNFQAEVPIPGITIKRGYVALDATVDGRTFRFVNTHLEPRSTFDGYFQALQAQELIATLAAEERPLILVGDLNAWAPTSEVYQGFLTAGYLDAWTSAAGSRGDGLTCCHVPSLDNPVTDFTRRIDLVLYRNTDDLLSNGRGLIHASVIGEEREDKTADNLWPSDHAGVVVRFQFPTPAV